MNCEYCKSKIFETDRVCDRCGAPNIISTKEAMVSSGTTNRVLFGGIKNQQIYNYISDKDFLDLIKI